MNSLPLTLLTHLTIFDASKWPIDLFLTCVNNALPDLQVLEVRGGDSLVESDSIAFPSDSKLRELYVSGTTCTFVDLSACISLVSLGIIIPGGHEAPAMYLPTTLQKLYLHNVLRQNVDTDWLRLCSLTYLFDLPQSGGSFSDK